MTRAGLLGGTAVILIMAIAVAPARADGGEGGSYIFSGVVGGIDSATSTGGAGGHSREGGGGGGAGTTGGNGGTSTASTVFGGPPVLGGAGGAAPGAAGAHGASYPGGANGGGGGGGGGAHGSIQAGVPLGNVSGGAGGRGGNADIINSADGAGGGGAGGWGAVVTGGGNLGTLSSTVTGGAGGDGGDGGNVRQSSGAQGGSGGIGLALAPGAGSAAPAITIDANVSGGGGGGGGYSRGAGGAGGSGGAGFSAGLNTVDANVTIIAGRTVAGGAGGSGGISYEAMAGPGTIGNLGTAGNPGGNGGNGLNGDPTGVGGAGAAGGLGVTFMATATLTNAGSIIGGNGGSGGSTRGGTGGDGGDGGEGGPGGPPGTGGNGGNGGMGGFGDAGGAGGTGGIAVMFAAAGTLFNTGTITAGAGGGAGQAMGGYGGLGGLGGFDIGGGGGINGAGGQGGIVRGGSNGGDGGIAVMFAATGALSNTGTVLGGVGGTGGDSIGGSGGASHLGGGNGADASDGGNAGNGGIAVMFAGAGTLSNTGTITAGAGGSGGQSAGGGGGAGGGFTNNGDNGGNGGNGSNGGTGGNGGTAVMFAGAGTLSNIGSIIGGAGGNGGQSTGGGGGVGGSSNGSVGQSGIGGAGGVGGSGVMFAGGGVLANTGNITGGAGGLGGMGSSLGAVGLGGAGVYGTDITVINSGSISGGLSGDGVTRANAVTFTGGANILELRAGFSFTGNVVDQTGNGTFQLGGGTAASFDISQLGTPQYQGFVSFAKVGDSTWTLTGTSTFAGPVNVNAGTLSVEGNLASATSLSVNTGGALDGTGTVGNTVIASGGSFAPGNGTPGSSTMVMGNLAFQSGAIYLVALNSATASFANVTGAATLGGASVNAAFAAGPFVNILKTYTILSAGSVSGTFGSRVNSNLPSGFQGSLRYDPTHAYLDLVLNFVPPSGSGLNRNQQNIANALTNSFNTAGSIPMAFGALTPTGLTQASGEVATGSQQTTFNAMNQFMGLMTDPFMNRGGGTGSAAGATGYAEEADSASAYAARKKNTDAFAVFTKAPPAPSFEQRWSVWTAGYGGSQTTDGNLALGSNNTTSSVYGTAVGADYLFSPNTVTGFALAGGGTNFSVNGSGSGRSDLFQAGAYVRHTEGAAYITAALAYGWQDITTDRIVTAGGFGHLRAEFDANAYSGRVESGYRFVTPLAGGIGITPYAAGQFTTFDLPAYAESVLAGSGAFALGYGARSVTDVRSELGIRTDKSYALADGILTLRSRFGWAHDYDPNRSVAATFQALPGASFVVNGAAQASDSALTTASAKLKWRNGWSVAATFEGEFSKVTNNYAGKGVVRYAW